MYLILTVEDQDVLSGALLAALPNLAFVNGTRWRTEQPPLVASIAAATAYQVLLWDRAMVPTLPCAPDAHGGVLGPSTGYVISLDRTSLGRNHLGKEVLISGALAWSVDNPSTEDILFQRTVWKVVRRCMSAKVKVANGNVAAGFLAGAGAVRWWQERPDERAFGLNAVENLATPVLTA
jgi:hypothetical protein